MSQQINFDHLFSGPPAAPALRPEEYLPPRSRRDDPLSSKRAEAEMQHSGRMKGQRMIVLELIERYPGYTSMQMADVQNGLDRYQIARRCRELVKLGLVRRPEDEPDYRKGEELRWWPRSVVRESK